jgi:hypothetical protein
VRAELSRILIVDDDEAASYVKCHLLRRHGYTVSDARLGREALTMAAAEVPDLMLLDVKVPDASGIEMPQDQIPLPTGHCPADLGRIHGRRGSHACTSGWRRLLSRRADRAGRTCCYGERAVPHAQGGAGTATDEAEPGGTGRRPDA